MGMLPASYRVKLGFGFHIGWAIEGAIGSIHKGMLRASRWCEIYGKIDFSDANRILRKLV